MNQRTMKAIILPFYTPMPPDGVLKPEVGHAAYQI